MSKYLCRAGLVGDVSHTREVIDALPGVDAYQSIVHLPFVKFDPSCANHQWLVKSQGELRLRGKNNALTDASGRKR